MSSPTTNKNNLQQWLQSINCLELFTTNDIINGILIHNILKNISPSVAHTLKELSPSNSMLTRVSNWNILSQQLKQFSIVLTQQNKNKIVNGNQDLIIDMIIQLKQYHLKKQKSSQVDLTQIDLKKDINDTQSLLEMMLILIMKNFHLSSKESVALLSNQSKYLAHILTKGLKGQFKGIQSFLVQMSKHIDKLIQFCKTNAQNIVFFLRSIKPALISKSQQISSLCMFNLFNKFLLHYSIQQRMQIFQTHLLSTYILTIKRHPSMQSAIIESIFQKLLINQQRNIKANAKSQQTIVNSQARGKLLHSVFNLLGSDSQKFSMVLLIVRIFGQKNAIKQFLNIQFFAKKVENAINSIKAQQYSLLCINIVIALNQYFPEIWSSEQNSQQQQNKLNSQQLSQNLVQNLKSIHITNIGQNISLTNQLFALLQQFGQEKHFIAPIIYKILIEKFLQIQALSVDPQNISQLYEVFLRNFKNIIQQFPSIPWNMIFEMIFNKNKSESSSYSQIQLQFFFFILDNPNMDIKYALMIYDTVSKLFMQSYHLSGLIIKIMIKILQLYLKQQPILEELSNKMIKVCLAIHHTNYKKLSQKRKSLTGNSKLNDQDSLCKIKNNSIQFMILKTAQLRFESINSKIQPLVAFSYIQMKEKQKGEIKGFKLILSVFGNPSDIIAKYEKQIKRAEDEAKQAKQKQKQQKQRLQKQKSMSSRIVKNQINNSHSKNRYDDGQINSARKDDSFALQQNSHHILLRKGQTQSLHQQNRSSLNVSSFLGSTAMVQKGIQKYQKVYLQKIQKQDLQKIRKQQQQQRFEYMKKLYKKKMLSQGIQIKGQTDQIRYLYEFDSQQNLILEKHFNKISYYTNQSQEDCDMKAVQKLMKLYSKSLRLIFSIYSGHSKGMLPQNFDQMAQKTIIIGSSNLYKFMKDFSFEDYVTLKQIQYLCQKVNIQKNSATSDYQILDFDGFVEFIKQVSFLMFTRPPKDLRGQPLAMMLEETFSNLKLFASQNRINEQIFQQPSSIFFNETQAVAQLNKKLEKNPDYILPEGYKKIVDKKINFQHKIFLEAINPTYKVVIEVIDELLFKVLGVHTIQPFTKQQKITKARPALFVAQRLKMDVMPTKHIPVKMKKQIAKIPVTLRPTAKQCAIVLDQIIEAIQLGHDKIGQKHLNKTQLTRKKNQQQQQKQYYIQKSKREARNRQSKTAIQQYKSKKSQKDKQLSTKKQEQQKKLLQQKQQQQKQKKQLKRKLQQYNKRKKQEEQQKLKKKKQVQQKQKKQRQRLKLINQQTRKKIEQQKKRKQQQQANKKLQRQLQQKKQKQLQKKKLQQSQLLKKQLVQDFKMKKSQVRDSSAGKQSNNKTLNKDQNKGSKKNLESYNQADNIQ